MTTTKEALPETPTPEFLEPFARKWCEARGIDPDEPSPPHGEWPRWYDECGAFAAMYSDMRAAMLAAAPPAPADDIAALRAENERLRAALGPFAAFAGIADDPAEPEYEKFICRGSGEPAITFGHLRRARAALNEGGKDEIR